MEERNRITKLAFAIVLLSFILSTAVSLFSLHSMAVHNQQELNRVLAAQIYDTISIELGEPTVVARTMRNDRFLIDLLEDETNQSQQTVTDTMCEYLSGIKEGLEFEAAFVVSETTGNYYSYQGLTKVINPAEDSYDRWYTDFAESGKEYALDVDNDELSQNAWTVFVNARIENRRGKLLGVGGVGFHMTKSRDLFIQLENQYHVKINLIDHEKEIKVDTDEEKIENGYLDEIDLGSVGPNEYVFQKLGGDRFAVTKYVESLDWYLVVQSDGATDTGSFINVILLNVLLFGLVMAILLMAIRIILARTNDLTKASFRDQSTGLFNRRAFEEAKASMMNKPVSENLVYLIADVNGLKTANDTLGHSAGDELIQGAADCLKEVFGNYGKIFRIGGDEFAAILSVPEEELPALKERFEAKVSEWSGNENKELAVSCGYVSGKEFPSENMSELSRIADERMYEAKEEYYRSSGKARRER
ncbi:MAG: GGDEF domain-containing protein [Solobacterium sp.]|nr:GGDEF domain-containing protein [Solobacterium sp.]